MKYVMIAAILAVGFLGCSSTPPTPPDFNNVAVTVAAGKSLKDVIVTSAAHRRWSVTELSAKELRCSILQRSNKVEIDITIEGPTTYSIRFVSSNIPEAKYLKWVNNLQHDIAKNAR